MGRTLEDGESWDDLWEIFFERELEGVASGERDLEDGWKRVWDSGGVNEEEMISICHFLIP